MRKNSILVFACIAFFQYSFAQKTKAGLVMNNIYEEELYIKSDSTKIMTYNMLYSDHLLRKDSTLIADDIEVYLLDATSDSKKDKKYKYYTVSIDKRIYSKRDLDGDFYYDKAYIVKHFEPT